MLSTVEHEKSFTTLRPDPYTGKEDSVFLIIIFFYL